MLQGVLRKNYRHMSIVEPRYYMVKQFYLYLHDCKSDCGVAKLKGWGLKKCISKKMHYSEVIVSYHVD